MPKGELVKKFLLDFILIVIVIYIFLIEPNMLTVKNYKINDNDLKGIKIVFASDFHIRPNQEKRLSEIVTKINEQQPDIFISVGDFVNGDRANVTLPVEVIVNHLKDIKTKYGSYTVLGNHDWWIGGEGIIGALTANGIKVLSNSNTKVHINGKDIFIAGVEDKATRIPNINKSLDGAKPPVIFLTHTPDLFPEVPNDVNIILAGHFHGGQVRLPLIENLFVPSEYGSRYALGLVEEKGKRMIVTKGIGTSSFPFRVNCIPEIVVIEFK